MKSKKKTPTREYPPVYEKIVPIILILLVVVIVGVLITAVGVALGLVA